MKPAVILCDIEGTTTSLSFVHNVLFPLSYERIEDFIQKNWRSSFLKTEIKSVLSQISNPNAGPGEIVAILRSWIREDRKEPVLKSIQGKIWKEAFESGEIKGHVYPDVPPNFRKWNDDGIKIGIFSSGSVEAQKLLFQYSEAGDLTPYISEYFDTSVGTKKSSSSYIKIAAELSLRTAEVLFLSDIEAELNAARETQMQTTQVVRENVVPNSSGHRMLKTFDAI